MKLKALKEPLLIFIFALLLIYFSFFQMDKSVPLSENLPPKATIIFEGTFLELSKSPIIHSLNNKYYSDIIKCINNVIRIENIEQNNLLVANLPKESMSHDRRWIMMIEIGNKNPWIRKKLNQFENNSWKRLENIAACPVWEFKPLEDTSSLKITLTENNLIACKSPYAHDIKMAVYYAQN